MSLSGNEQGHCSSACPPLSRLAVTLLCTAGGAVMQHEQQHLCVCYRCGTTPSPVSSLSSCSVNLDLCHFFLLDVAPPFFFCCYVHEATELQAGGRGGVAWWVITPIPVHTLSRGDLNMFKTSTDTVGAPWYHSHGTWWFLRSHNCGRNFRICR